MFVQDPPGEPALLALYRRGDRLGGAFTIDRMVPLMKMRRLLLQEGELRRGSRPCRRPIEGRDCGSVLAEPEGIRYNNESKRRGVEQAGQLVGLITRRS